MSFDNHYYPNRKDHRRQYPDKARRCDASCRSHGGCKYCLNNRMHRVNKANVTLVEQTQHAEDQV